MGLWAANTTAVFAGARMCKAQYQNPQEISKEAAKTMPGKVRGLRDGYTLAILNGWQLFAETPPCSHRSLGSNTNTHPHVILGSNNHGPSASA